MEYNLHYRNDLIWAGHRIHRSTQPKIMMKKLSKKYGNIVELYHQSWVKHYNDGCYAVVRDLVDADISNKLGWKTIREICSDKHYRGRNE